MDKLTSLLLGTPLFNGKKKEMSKSALYAVRGVCLLLVAVFVFGATVAIMPRQSVLTNTIYSSSVGVDASYEVNLAKNNFFENDILGMGENYIRSVVDGIDIDFDIDCQHSGNGETIVAYDVTSRISAWYRNGSDNLLIWDINETLVEASSTDMSQSDCSFTVPVSIEPKIYSKMIESFQKDMEINVNAYYDITISGKATYISGSRGSSENFYAHVSIPLTGQVFKVSTEVPKERYEKEFTESRIIESEPNVPMFCVLIFAALLAAFAVLVSFLCLTEKVPDSFKTDLNKMIGQIEDRIAYVQGEQTCKASDIMLADFDSIIRLADERALPIFCVRDDVDRTAVFFVTENNQKFYYGFSGDSLDEEAEEESFDESVEGTEEETVSETAAEENED